MKAAQLPQGVVPSIWLDNADVGSVVSISISRRDAGVAARLPTGPTNSLGVSIAGRTCRAARRSLLAPRRQCVYSAGTGTKDTAAISGVYKSASGGLGVFLTVRTRAAANDREFRNGR